MKKNLLAITMLVVTSIAYAQDTYIGDKAVVKVQPNTLFYNGGNVSIAPNTQITGTSLTEIVKNQGYIEIAKDYTNSIVDSKGAEFINIYTDNTNYGQVIIKGTNAATTGKLTMQKKSVESSKIQQFPMTFPFRDNAEQMMFSYTGKSDTDFKGNCAVGVRCNQRYNMTLFYWNNNNIVNDPVQSGTKIIPGGYYLLNLISATGLNSVYNGNVIDYKGTPAPNEVTFSNTTVAPNINGFAGLTYNNWKNKINAYNETYYSYLGLGNNDLKYGKNMFRFGNPYTSNINLSNPTTWMNLNDSFELTKLTQGYRHTWNNQTGSSENSTGSSQFLKAVYSGGNNGEWTGDAEAVLVRPLEMFQVKFQSDNLVTLNLSLTDDHKTFKQDPTTIVTISPRSQANNQFHQLKVALVDTDNNIVSDPIYLASSNNFETGNNLYPVYNSTFYFLEENNDGDVIANAYSHINTFNDDYVAKPIHLGLNGLPLGNTYKLKFNLKENNIFTDDVNKYSNGSKFYLHDKVNDTYTEINSSTEININITEKSLDQYAFYWKDTPKTLNTVELDSNHKTQVYKFAQDAYHVRLDTSKKTANIEIYSIAGTKVANQTNINVTNSNDIKLNIPNGVTGLYIIKVVYDDGSNKNLKVLVD